MNYLEKKMQILQLFAIAVLIACSSSSNSWYSVSANNVTVVDPELENSLYRADESVQLTSANFERFFNETARNRSILVQFYNHWCPHCQEFRDIWVELKTHLDPKWNEIVTLAVANCAMSKKICQQFAISVTPTLLYFPPHSIQFTSEHKPQKNAEIVRMPHSTRSKMLTNLIDLLRRNHSAPILCPSLAWHTFNSSFASLDDHGHPATAALTDNHHVFFVTQNNSSIDELIVDFCAMTTNESNKNRGRIRLVSVTRFDNRTYRSNMLYLLNRMEIEPVEIIANVTQLKSVIVEYLKLKFNESYDESQGLVSSSAAAPLKSVTDETTDTEPSNEQQQQRKTTIHLMKALMALHNRDFIYLDDLKKSLNYSIGHELHCRNEPSRRASERFLRLIYDLVPLHGKEKIAVERAISVLQQNRNCSSTVVFDSEMIRADRLHWIGCECSVTKRSRTIRGYTCGLWQSFHFMTLRAYADGLDVKPVLRTIYDYVKYFFGCQECRNHFLEMEQLEPIAKIESNADAVLWLWHKHNLVNERLHGSGREDPEYPKIQFPHAKFCAQCWLSSASANGSVTAPSVHDSIDRVHVLDYLVRTYTNLETDGLDAVFHKYTVNSSNKVDVNDGGGTSKPASYMRSKREWNGAIILTNSDILLFLVIYVVSIVLSIFVYQFSISSRFRRRFCNSGIGYGGSSG